MSRDGKAHGATLALILFAVGPLLVTALALIVTGYAAQARALNGLPASAPLPAGLFWLVATACHWPFLAPLFPPQRIRLAQHRLRRLFQRMKQARTRLVLAMRRKTRRGGEGR
jgi:hypothetical protein